MHIHRMKTTKLENLKQFFLCFLWVLKLRLLRLITIALPLGLLLVGIWKNAVSTVPSDILHD